jgi:hypothetical protein
MPKNTPQELLDKGFITADQYTRIDLITSGKIVSVFYELRSLLYLGVLLLTTGVGILIYLNIGDLGHLISIGALIVVTAICFAYVFKNAPAYSNLPVKGPTPYYDYIVLLGALLFISVLGYLQFQFNILDENLGHITLITSAFFFYIAYRFDHVGVLSLAITALASFFSISVSPQKWYSGDFLSEANLHVTGIIFSVVVAGVAMVLDKRSIKTHFTFTYVNFCCLIFFTGAVSGLFVDYQIYLVYVLLIYAGCAFAYFMARYKKSFIFMLYGFIAGYIGTTYLLAETILDDPAVWLLYSLASCGGFVFFIIRFKNFFNR